MGTMLRAGTAEISIPDTSLQLGLTIDLPMLLNTTDDARNASCTLMVSIPKKRLLLKEVITKPGTLFSCKNPTITLISEDAERRMFAITCQNPLIQSQGILLFLRVEALAGTETSSQINATSFLVGGTNQSIIQSGGTITFTDPPVIQAKAEGMDLNIPNPFEYTTSFIYHLGTDGEVQFTLFNAQGKVIQEFPIEFKNAGRHTFVLSIDDPTNFSSGVYIIRMRTERGLYHMSMVHKK
ncbi:MAG: T9SS type A sorting domain-containing protein [Ignavibacteria bacterium]|nr:T9SS type A sorting domain-containing protein [Ignavibacteria bacterium]